MVCFNPNIPQFETGFNKGIKVQLHIIKSRQTEERNHWEKHVSSFADSKSIENSAPEESSRVPVMLHGTKDFLQGRCFNQKRRIFKTIQRGRAAPCTREYSAEAAAGKTIT